MALFAPFSSGSPEARAALAVQAAAHAFPRLSELLTQLSGVSPAPPIPATAFCVSTASRAAAESLRMLFDRHGSDKSSAHNYHLIYGRVLGELTTITKILEIGMGSTNQDIVSNMGGFGRPGASLRAFRDFAGSATIYGADIDRAILFEEERIKTFFVDQTAPATLEELGEHVGDEFDLIIDDGLHTVSANVAVLTFAIPRVRVGGWVVIEDIAPAACSAWQVLARLMPSRFACQLLEAQGGLVFVAQRMQ